MSAAVVLPWLAVAWLSAPASACADMLLPATVERDAVYAGGAHADADAAHPHRDAHVGHGHGDAHVGHGHGDADVGHGHGDAHGLHAHDGAAAEADRGSRHAAHLSPDSGTPVHDHGLCPHCPPAPLSDVSAAHLVCDATPGAADQRVPSTAQWDLKHAFPAASRVAPASAVATAGAFVAAPRDRPPAPVVPLNIRYCVFLI